MAGPRAQPLCPSRHGLCPSSVGCARLLVGICDGGRLRAAAAESLRRHLMTRLASDSAIASATGILGGTPPPQSSTPPCDLDLDQLPASRGPVRLGRACGSIGHEVDRCIRRRLAASTSWPGRERRLAPCTNQRAGRASSGPPARLRKRCTFRAQPVGYIKVSVNMEARDQAPGYQAGAHPQSHSRAPSERVCSRALDRPRHEEPGSAEERLLMSLK
jgi:hypothetical protein